MREQTYYSQLCLIQISDGTHAAAVDPLQVAAAVRSEWARELCVGDATIQAAAQPWRQCALGALRQTN